MKFNFADVEVKEQGEIIPQGSYDVTITDGELRGEDTDKPYWNVEFTIDEGQPQANRKIWENLYLNPEALWKLKLLLKELDYDVDGDLDIEVDELFGRKLNVTVKHNEGKGKSAGKTFANISRFKGTATSGGNSMLP